MLKILRVKVEPKPGRSTVSLSLVLPVLIHCITFWITFSADYGCHAQDSHCILFVVHCDKKKITKKLSALRLLSNFMIKIQHVTVQRGTSPYNSDSCRRCSPDSHILVSFRNMTELFELFKDAVFTPAVNAEAQKGC